MYFSIAIIIFALLLIVVSTTCRRRWAIKKVCSLTCAYKCELFNSLIEPFGYCYDPSQDIISSRNDAWQRAAGYTALFDRAAPLLNMVFDDLPIYFDYKGRTWLIELWKGQYGINTGAEVGIYYADRILDEEELSTALFQCVDDEDMLPVSLLLLKENHLLARVAKKTWWLTVFCMGLFSKPSSLFLNVSIGFPDCDMLQSFLNALYQTRFPKQSVQVCGLKVSLLFEKPLKCSYHFWQRIIRGWAQFWNRCYCKLFLFITRYFTLTIDRMLYLYYLLPFAFRRMLQPRKYRKKNMHKIKMCKRSTSTN